MELDFQTQNAAGKPETPALVTELLRAGESWTSCLESAKATALARATLGCGDLSPLSLLTGLPAGEGALSARPNGRNSRILRCDGDESPAHGGDKPPHSRRLGRWLAVIGVLALSLGAARAQNFSIDWHTIDGGGGTSSGGNFSLSGTIGQPDASAQPMTGGAFSLTGGFWSLFAVQNPGAPRLIIERVSATIARISWPSQSAGFVLQQSAGVNTTNWISAPQAVSDNGTSRFITVNPSAGRHFYRLFKR